MDQETVIAEIVQNVRDELVTLARRGRTGTITIHVGASEYQVVVSSHGEKIRRPVPQKPDAPRWK